MKYLEIYLNERQKEVEDKLHKIVESIKNDISIEENEYTIIENIYTNYIFDIYDIVSKLEEIERFKKDLLGSDKNENN